jgi:hypothetical protein
MPTIEIDELNYWPRAEPSVFDDVLDRLEKLRQRTGGQMPFEPGTSPPRSTLPKKGKSKSRRYQILWCYREDDSNRDEELYKEEIRSTNVLSAITALVRMLNEDDSGEKLRKADINVIECRFMGR